MLLYSVCTKYKLKFMVQLIPSTQDILKSWRDQYFDSLPYAQDMHSESMISWMPGVAGYTISRNDTHAGYVILNNSGELVEFYIQSDLLTQKEAIFSEVIRQLDIKSVYCKSFDQVLLSCCHKFFTSSKLVGYLFQEYSAHPSIMLDDTVNVRLATIDDVPFLNSFDNEMLDEGEEIDPYVKNNSVYMFMKGEELIGCGYLFNVIQGRKHYDVGMWINQAYRQKGYGAQIIAYLMRYCFENGFIPTAGCEESNTASRRTLEKCGFISKLCLINFQF